jgi:3-oxoacyl-[acyl-carrier protein] reductase
MDLQINEKYFLITGAGSGFGRAIVEQLLEEGAFIIVNSRTEEKLIEIKNLSPSKVQYVAGDITDQKIQNQLLNLVNNHDLTGAVINSGGPVAKSVLETEMKDWDEAYHSVMRWKIQLTQQLIPHFVAHKYGRMVFIESISVKQPVENLVLSNAFRMAMVGYIKTLSQEVGHLGINLNTLAPGYHDTHAMKRIITKKSETKGLSIAEARKHIEKETMMGKMGDPKDFASLALWLLSPQARYVTGQTISVDGGLTKGVFG